MNLCFSVTLPMSIPLSSKPRPAERPLVAHCRGRREVRLLHYLNRTFGLHVWLHINVDSGLFVRP